MKAFKILAVFVFTFTYIFILFNYSSAEGIQIYTGTGQGAGPQIRSFNDSGNPTEINFFAYNKSFRGGVRVATGDLDGDYNDEIITAAGPGGGPHLGVYDSRGKWTGWATFPFSINFRGGIDVATGNIDADSTDEIAVVQFSGGQAWVKLYHYDDRRTVISQFNAFGNFSGGGTVTMGDVDEDGKDEVIIGAGSGGGPQVRVFEANGTPLPIQFFAFHKDSRTGVDVAAGDIDNDGRDEIAVSQLRNGEAWIKVYNYNHDQSVIGEWRAFPAGVECGANIEMYDINNDGKAEIIAGAGPGGSPQIRIFDTLGNSLGNSFFAYGNSLRSGANPVATNTSSMQVVNVIDGDSIKLKNGEEIRYIGVNSPELEHPYYEAATAFNKKLTLGRTVRIENGNGERDRFGRHLAYVYVNNTLANLRVAEKGYAQKYTVPPNGHFAGDIAAAEANARRQGIGMWKRSPLTKLSIRNVSHPDSASLNTEWVEIYNSSNSNQNLRDFTLWDSSNKTYTFPNFNLRPMSSVRVYSGCGTNTSSKLYWCTTRNVWHQNHDGAYLRDRKGLFVGSYVY